MAARSRDQREAALKAGDKAESTRNFAAWALARGAAHVARKGDTAAAESRIALAQAIGYRVTVDARRGGSFVQLFFAEGDVEVSAEADAAAIAQAQQDEAASIVREEMRKAALGGRGPKAQTVALNRAEQDSDGGKARG